MRDYEYFTQTNPESIYIERIGNSYFPYRVVKEGSIVADKVKKTHAVEICNELLKPPETWEIMVTDSYASVRGCLHLIVLNEENKGYRTSQKAYEALKTGRQPRGIYSARFKGEVIWVTNEEFNKNGLTEVEVPVEKTA